ncbi:MAG: hypothetical protein EXS68_02315 [Candidatus Ryanbacteria bacterium]|nr:hypothetical protein [Candidatus Ryanbacteria bacterium]
MSDRIFFICVVLIKLFVLLVSLVLLGQGHFFWGDSLTYIHSAESLLEEGVYGDARRTPLYPLLLAFFLGLSKSYGIVLLLGLQVVVAAYSAVLVRRIAALFVKKPYPLLAAMLFAFEPLGAIINMLVLAETFLVFFLLVFAWYFLSYYKNPSRNTLIASAVALAAAVWTKPVAAYLVVIPLCFLIFVLKKKRPAALYAAIYCAAILPWVFFVYSHFHFFGISAQGENNACGYMLTSVFSTEYRTDPSDMDASLFPSAFTQARASCTGTLSSIRIALQYPESFGKTLFLSTLSMLTNEGYAILFQNAPEESLKAHHNYLTLAVFADAHWYTKIKGAVGELRPRELFIVGAGKLFWIVITLLAIGGAYRSIADRDKRWQALFLLAIVFYFISITVISTGYGVGARLRYPINPFLFIVASIGLASAVAKMRAR